jgi:hypothetical protein
MCVGNQLEALSEAAFKEAWTCTAALLHVHSSCSSMTVGDKMCSHFLRLWIYVNPGGVSQTLFHT